MYDTLFPLPTWFLADGRHPIGSVAVFSPVEGADMPPEARVCFPLFGTEKLAYGFCGGNRAGTHAIPVRTPVELHDLLAHRIDAGYTHVALVGREGGPPRRVRRLADTVRSLGGACGL